MCHKHDTFFAFLLYQLSYPSMLKIGWGGFEPPTVRSHSQKIAVRNTIMFHFAILMLSQTELPSDNVEIYPTLMQLYLSELMTFSIASTGVNPTHASICLNTVVDCPEQSCTPLRFLSAWKMS